jgi:hypothetical protein
MRVATYLPGPKRSDFTSNPTADKLVYIPIKMPANDQVLSKQGEPIEKGDHVYTKIRGGRHEGDVRAFARCELHHVVLI